jgi:arginyl-tRNA synthetase
MKEELANEIQKLLEEFKLPQFNVDFRQIPFPGSWGYAFAGTFAIAGLLVKSEDAMARCPIYEVLFPPDEKPDVKKAATKLAEMLASKIRGGPVIERAIEENGYLNLYLKPQPYSASLLNRVLADPDGWSKGKRRQEQIMVEYSQPNTHKRFHVGHLRNACLGATIIRAMRHAGYPVIASNYFGDIGAHVIKCLWGLTRFHSDEATWPKDPTEMAQFLGEVYVDAEERLNESIKLKEQAVELIRSIIGKACPLVPQARAAALAGELNVFLDQNLITFADNMARQDYIDNIKRSLAFLRDSAEGMQRADSGPLTPLIRRILRYLRVEREVFDYEESCLLVYQRWDKHDSELMQLWELTSQASLQDFHRIYKDLNCPFDIEFFESEVEAEGKKMVVELVEKGLAEISQGATVMDLDRLTGSKEGTYRVLLLLRSDGSSLYSTKEIALAKRKFDNFELDRSVYVVADHQNFYFKQLFKALELMGYDWANKCIHLSFGMVTLPEGKMASRKGNIVLYDDLVQRMIDEASKVLAEKRPDLPADEKEKIIRAVAYGGLKFDMVAVENQKSIVFDWERALEFDGRAAPYLQYAHARACRILEGAEIPTQVKVPDDLSLTDQEVELLKKIEEFPAVIERCADEYTAHHLANHAFELCQAYSDFYTNCPVLKSDEPLRSFRLGVVAAFRATLATALGIMGIEAPEKM